MWCLSPGPSAKSADVPSWDVCGSCGPDATHAKAGITLWAPGDPVCLGALNTQATRDMVTCHCEPRRRPHLHTALRPAGDRQVSKGGNSPTSLLPKPGRHALPLTSADQTSLPSPNEEGLLPQSPSPATVPLPPAQGRAALCCQPGT